MAGALKRPQVALRKTERLCPACPGDGPTKGPATGENTPDTSHFTLVDRSTPRQKRVCL